MPTCTTTQDKNRSRHSNRHFLDRVIAVPQSVPLDPLRLSTTGQIGRTCAKDEVIRFLHARNQLPPLPAVAIAFADETRFSPAAAVHAHLNTRNRRRSGPSHAADGHFTRAHLCIRRWLGNQGADPLQCDRLAEDPIFALPFIPVLVALIVSGERPIDEFDLGQPLDRRDRVPAWNDETQWITV